MILVHLAFGTPQHGGCTNDRAAGEATALLRATCRRATVGSIRLLVAADPPLHACGAVGVGFDIGTLDLAVRDDLVEVAPLLSNTWRQRSALVRMCSFPEEVSAF